MKKTAKKQIEMLLRTEPRWFGGNEIEIAAIHAGYKPSNFSRRCREMFEDGAIERRLFKGFVQYKWIPKFDINDYNIY
jgi:hypothetical protein